MVASHVSLPIPHEKSKNRDGWHIVKSMDDRDPVLPSMCVEDLSLKRHRLLFCEKVFNKFTFSINIITTPSMMVAIKVTE